MIGNPYSVVKTEQAGIDVETMNRRHKDPPCIVEHWRPGIFEWIGRTDRLRKPLVRSIPSICGDGIKS